MEMLRCAYFRKKGKNMFLFFFAIRHTNDCSNEHFQAWVVVEFIPYAHNNKAFFYSVYVFFSSLNIFLVNLFVIFIIDLKME